MTMKTSTDEDLSAGELEVLTATYPLRERLWGLRALALKPPGGGVDLAAGDAGLGRGTGGVEDSGEYATGNR